VPDSATFRHVMVDPQAFPRSLCLASSVYFTDYFLSSFVDPKSSVLPSQFWVLRHWCAGGKVGSEANLRVNVSKLILGWTQSVSKWLTTITSNDD